MGIACVSQSSNVYHFRNRETSCSIGDIEPTEGLLLGCLSLTLALAQTCGEDIYLRPISYLAALLHAGHQASSLVIMLVIIASPLFAAKSTCACGWYKFQWLGRQMIQNARTL